MTLPQRPRLRFGPFEFDGASGELSRNGVQVRLQEQPRQVLAALLEQPGTIATREMLRERLWKSDTFVDFEHGLNTAIKKVRQALGDSADAPRFIETLAKRGYRFIAPVEPALDPARAETAGERTLPVQEGQPARRGEKTPAVPRTATWTRLAWAAGLILLVTAAFVWAVRTPSRDLAAHARPATGVAAQLAVLPLKVLDAIDAAGTAYLGTGIADTITTRLASARLMVRPTSVVLPFKDAQSDPAGIARALGVQYLLLGTVQPGTPTYRISLQLVDAGGATVWGRTYDEPFSGLLALQDHIAEQVVTTLRVELTPPERARLHVRYTQNPAAYDLYLRGRALLLNYTEANMHDALEYFERALALDDRFALARSASATAAAWFSVRYAYEVDALDWGRRADEQARLALAQDPSLAEAQLAIASAAGTLYGGFNWPEVLERTETALGIDASLDLAHVVRMRAFYHLGQFDRAREEDALARALNPTSTTERLRLEVAVDLFSGRFEAAAREAQALIGQTEAPVARHYLGLARYYTGDVAGARAMLDSATRGGKPDVRAQASLASIEAASGLRDAARRRAAVVKDGPYMDHHVAYSLGATFAQLGDHDAGVNWLRQAAQTGFTCPSWYERDPLLDPIRRHPGFVKLLAELHGSTPATAAPAHDRH